MPTKPFELIASPFAVYIAPTGTSFTDISVDPTTTTWVLLGASGDRSINTDGVTVAHPQTVEEVRVAGSTGARKAFRTEEDLTVTFMLLDPRPAVYSKLINNNTVNTTAAGSGVAGAKDINLYRDREVALHALLLKADDSPLDDGTGWKSQLEIPWCYVASEPEVVWNKGVPVGLNFVFRALEDPDASSAAERFGRFVAQDADATA